MKMKHLAPAAGLAIAMAITIPAAARAADCKSPVADSDLIKPGTLIMSTNPTLPPLQYVDSSGTLKGMRIELGIEIAKRLCLTPDYIKIDFDAMVPGLQAGRWDMINTGIFYTDKRAQIMYMIPYENQAISISVLDANKDKVKKPEDLAGKAVAVEIGGFEESKARELSTKLEGEGLKPLTIRTFDTFATAYQALKGGQVDAVVSIDGVAKEYQERGEFVRAISGLDATPVALAFNKKGLAEAVDKVLEDMKKDGSYDKLFDTYGVPPFDKPFVVKGPDL